MQLLKDELTISRKLRHPHVVLVYGVCVFSGTELWLVMEYADKGSIQSLLSDYSKVWCF